MKITVIGSNGQLGSDIVKEFSLKEYEVVGLTHTEIEVSNFESVRSVLTNVKPDVVVNTAAMHNVEKCEQEQLRSFEVNSLGAKYLAETCNEINSVLVHISTDYVFDGKKNSPYAETDKTTPLNVYGNTKVSGEQFIEAIAKKYFIMRTSGVYGHSPCRAKGGLNFVELMLKLAKEKPELRVVDDEILTPTSTKEIAPQLIELIKTDAYGLYHSTAEGSCSWFQFAKKIFELTSTKANLQIAGLNEFPMKVPRPKYSVLENANLKSRGINIMKSWEDGLKEYLNSNGR